MNIQKKVKQTKFYDLAARLIIEGLFLLPIDRRKVIFDNFDGGGYGGNPKYIAEELCKDKQLKLIWITNKENGFPSYIKPVKKKSLQAYYHSATAKMRVTNIRYSSFTKKRKGQYQLQTWHASDGFKLVEKDIVEQLSPYYKKKAIYDGSITDGGTLNEPE